MAGLSAIATFGLRFVAKDQASSVIKGLAKDFKFINRITGRGFEEVAAKIGETGLAGKVALGTSAFVAMELMQGLTRATTMFTGALSNTLSKAAEFQTNMQTFSVIAGKGTEGLNDLKQKIIAFTAPLPTTANEVAKAAVEFARMGFAVQSTSDQMIRMSFEAIKFGRAINATDAQAALFLGKLMTWLAVSTPTAEKMNEIASVVTRLGWRIKGTSKDIIKATERFGAFVRAMGATESETLALAALMVDSGVQIRRGSTAINRTFQLMAVNIDAFGSALSEIKAVKSARDFEKLFRAEPVKAFEVLLRGLSTQGGAQAAMLLKTAGLHGNYISDLITMSRNVEKLTSLTAEYTDELSKSGTEQSAVNQAYKANLETYDASMKILAGSIENIKIIMGSPLLSPLSEVAVSFADIVAFTITWVPWLFKAVGGLLLVAAGFLIVAKMIVFTTATLEALKIAGLLTFRAWTIGLLKIVAIFIAIIAVATLVVWIVNMLRGKFKSYTDTLAGVTGKIGEVGSTVISGAAGGLAAVGSEEMPETGGMALPGAAAGGIVVQPTPVVVGEAGAEAIIPLRELASMLGNFATSRQASPAETRVTVTSPIYLDGMEIGRTVRESAAIESLRQGRLS